MYNMKTPIAEDNQANKFRFYKQYVGRPISFVPHGSGSMELILIGDISVEIAKELIVVKLIEEGYELELIRSIDITINKADDNLGIEIVAEVEHAKWGDHVLRLMIVDESMNSCYVDILRYHGFAVPWHGVSVKEQIRRKWIISKKSLYHEY